jgi:hypothetical protein
MFPEGTKFKIADAVGSATKIEVKGFDDIGDLGLEAKLTDVSVLSDDTTVFEKNARKDGQERDIVFRYDPNDSGQIEVIEECNNGERRDCEVLLPSGKKWQFTAVFGDYVIPKPEAGKAMQLVAKVGIETDQGGVK